MESRMTNFNHFIFNEARETEKRSFLARSFAEESPLQSVIDLLFYTMQIEGTPFIAIDIFNMDNFVANRLRSICMLSFQSNYTKMIEEVNNDPTIKALWMKFKIEEVSHKIVFEFREEIDSTNQSICDTFPEFYDLVDVFTDNIQKGNLLFLEGAIVKPTIFHEDQFINFAEGVNTYEFFHLMDEIIKYEYAGFFKENGMKLKIPQSYFILYSRVRDVFIRCIGVRDFKYFSIVSPVTDIDPNEQIELLCVTTNGEEEDIEENTMTIEQKDL